MSNALSQALHIAAVATLRAIFNADLLKVRKGGKSKRTFEEAVSGIHQPACLARLWDTNPLQAYQANARARRSATEREAELIATSAEVAAHGILACGEPKQVTLFVMSHVRILFADWDGEQFKAEAERMAYAAQAAIQFEKKKGRDVEALYLRYKPNVVVRLLRNKSTNPLRALFGGRLYYSDAPNHSGNLLAVVTANAGDRTALGRIEWAVPGFAKGSEVPALAL